MILSLLNNFIIFMKTLRSIKPKVIEIMDPEKAA